jgi:hypothetical protein
MGRKPQVVVVERTHGMRGFPDGARSSRGRASTKMMACHSRGARHSAPARGRGHNQVKYNVLYFFHEQPTRRTSHLRSRWEIHFSESLGRPKEGRLSVRARDRGSSIHTRLGFMQRRLVKIEIISDTI